MAELRNEFSWSFSRHRLFRSCLRAYYLNHYGSWGGWSDRAPPRVRERYLQKKLTTVPMWVGSRVHEGAERWLRSLRRGRPEDPDDVARAQVAAARRDVEDSRTGRWRRRPGRMTGFDVHYYGGDLPAERWEEAIAEIGRQVRSLARNRVAARLAEAPGRIVQVEELERFDVDGVPVWVRLDLLVDDGRGGLVIVDWKTGASHVREEVAEQLGIYALYARDVHGVDPARVQAMDVNLRSGRWTTHRVDPATVEAARELVRGSAARMRARLVDVEANAAREEDFPPLPEGAPACRTCRFRGDCDRAGPPA